MAESSDLDRFHAGWTGADSSDLDWCHSGHTVLIRTSIMPVEQDHTALIRTSSKFDKDVMGARAPGGTFSDPDHYTSDGGS